MFQDLAFKMGESSHFWIKPLSLVLLPAAMCHTQSFMVPASSPGPAFRWTPRDPSGAWLHPMLSPSGDGPRGGVHPRVQCPRGMKGSREHDQAVSDVDICMANICRLSDSSYPT